MAAAYR